MQISKTRYFKDTVLWALLTIMALILSIPSINGFLMDRKIITAVIYLVVYGAVAFMIMRKGKSKENMVLLVLLTSFMARSVYVVNTVFDVAPHDLFFMNNDGTIAHGHLGYIEYFYNFKQLPDFNPMSHWSFYNPPLHHILSAIGYGFWRALGFNSDGALEMLQVQALVICTVSIYLLKNIIEEFKIRESLKLTFTTLAAFFPPLVWMSASLSSDPLSFMFLLIAVLYSIRWYKNQTFKNIIGIALGIGLGMMTKLTVAYVSFSTAFLFLYALIELIKSKKSVVNHIKQYAVFGAICVPLGLWWPIRCKVLFDMPFNYIQRLPEDCQYLGNYSLLQRFGFPTSEQLACNFVSINEDLDCNVWWTMIKTFLFDEDTSMKPYTVTLTLINEIALKVSLIMFLVAFILMVKMFVTKSKRVNWVNKVYFLLLTLPIMASYIYFQIDYPFVCTMNARYITVVFTVPLISSAIAVSDIRNEKLDRYFSLGAYLMSGLIGLLFVVFVFSTNAFA